MIRLISVVLAVTLGAAAIGVWLYAGSSGAAEAADSIPDGAAAIAVPSDSAAPGPLTPPDDLTPAGDITPPGDGKGGDGDGDGDGGIVGVATALPVTGNGLTNTDSGVSPGVLALIGGLVAAGAAGLGLFGWRQARVR